MARLTPAIARMPVDELFYSDGLPRLPMVPGSTMSLASAAFGKFPTDVLALAAGTTESAIRQAARRLGIRRRLSREDRLLVLALRSGDKPLPLRVVAEKFDVSHQTIANIEKAGR